MKIVIVDDDRLVSTSLKTIVESDPVCEVVGVGNNGVQAIELYQKYKPDVLLMDIRMDEMTGIEAANVILQEDAAAKILFLTTFVDDEYIIQALRMGAKGYLLKQDFECIVPALKAVDSGQSVFGGEIVSKLPKLLEKKQVAGYSELGITPKEYEMIQLVAKGLSNKEIADTLYLSEGTVRNYLSSILDKLELRDRTQLAIFYYQRT